MRSLIIPRSCSIISMSHLVRVVVRATHAVNIERIFHHFSVELDIFLFLLADNNEILEVEVHQHGGRLVAGLEDSVLDVRVHNVSYFGLGGGEAEAILMSFNRSYAFSATDLRPHDNLYGY